MMRCRPAARRPRDGRARRGPDRTATVRSGRRVSRGGAVSMTSARAYRLGRRRTTWASSRRASRSMPCLAIFPAIIAAVSVYALVANPSNIKSQLDPLIKAPAAPAAGISSSTSCPVRRRPVTAGSASAWSSVSSARCSPRRVGVRALMIGLNVIYDRTDRANFVQVRVFAWP